MRFVSAMFLVALLAAPAMAGQNPDCKIFVDFNADDDCTRAYADVVKRADPTAMTQQQAYIVLGDIAGACESPSLVGITAVSFAIGIEPAGMSLVTSYENILPGGLQIGSWTDGITLSSTSPVAGPLVYVATVTVFYSGTPGEIQILEHPFFPAWVVDAGAPVPVQDYYCVANYGGVWMDPTDPDPGCELNTAIEAGSWGSIKALYK